MLTPISEPVVVFPYTHTHTPVIPRVCGVRYPISNVQFQSSLTTYRTAQKAHSTALVSDTCGPPPALWSCPVLLGWSVGRLAPICHSLPSRTKQNQSAPRRGEDEDRRRSSLRRLHSCPAARHLRRVWRFPTRPFLLLLRSATTTTSSFRHGICCFPSSLIRLAYQVTANPAAATAASD